MTEQIEKGWAITCNITNRIIRDNTLWDEYLESKYADCYDQNKVSHYFKDTSVLCIYNHRMIRLDGAVIDMTPESEFPTPDYKTFKDYFNQRYGIELKHNDQFLVYRNRK